MKFKELNKKAQERAIEDYLDGWEETHSDDPLSIREAYVCLMDLNDDYDNNGVLRRAYD